MDVDTYRSWNLESCRIDVNRRTGIGMEAGLGS
jgi:hypothetical protein